MGAYALTYCTILYIRKFFPLVYKIKSYEKNLQVNIQLAYKSLWWTEIDKVVQIYVHRIYRHKGRIENKIIIVASHTKLPLPSHKSTVCMRACVRACVHACVRMLACLLHTTV